MNAYARACFLQQSLRPWPFGLLSWAWVFIIWKQGVTDWQVLHLLAPAVLGISLVDFTHELMHCPHTALLPGGRRRFLLWHGTTIALGALALTGLTQLLLRVGAASGPMPPPPTTFAIVATVLSLHLPREPGLRWCGSRMLFFLIVGAGVIAIARDNVLRSWSVTDPWLTVAVCAGIVTGCYVLAGARERFRARATMPFIPDVGWADPEYYKRRLKDARARDTRTGRSWRQGPVGDSTLGWMRAVLHAQFGQNVIGWWSIVAFFSSALVLAGLFAGLLQGGPWRSGALAVVIYQALFEPPAHGLNASGVILSGILFLVLGVLSEFLLARVPLPISRARQARVTHALFVLIPGIVLVSVVAGTTLLGWVCANLANVPFRPMGLPAAIVGCIAVLPVLPLWQAGTIWRTGPLRLTAPVDLAFGLGAAGLILGAALAAGAVLFPAEFFSATGLTFYAIAVPGGQWALRTALHWKFRHSDLI